MKTLEREGAQLSITIEFTLEEANSALVQFALERGLLPPLFQGALLRGTLTFVVLNDEPDGLRLLLRKAPS